MVGGSVVRERRVSAKSSDHQIRFARSADGARIAYASHGEGPPLIVVSCWLSHLQHDWESPVWRHFLDDLGAFTTLIRYDERGFGMSDLNVTDFSLEARVHDLEAVVAALGIERFAILGMSNGSGVAMSYVARHPERVTRLVLYGTMCGEAPTFTPDHWAEEETYRSLIKVGWAREDPVFRRVFTSRYIPDASEEQMRWFDELQRTSGPAENVLASRIARQGEDFTAEVDRIRAPTLVLQALGDSTTTFENAGMVAARVPGTRVVPIDSRNHILLAGEPGWQTFVAQVREFLEPDRIEAARLSAAPPSAELAEPLSERELEVLRKAADGLANDEIAADLGLSPRTVERHLSNAYAKLGVRGKAARAAAVAEVMRRGLA
jgi:pimeloyl-ACP methyl ester carboxylesterase/DNA-binding CsgD family transcriptional regulator